MSDAIFRKTEKGQEEIKTRSAGLNPRQRRILILIDGQKSVSQLRELAATDDLTHVLSTMEELGLIELVGTVDEMFREGYNIITELAKEFLTILLEC